MATYELKPRLNRLDGVASVLVQGGQEPEFHITPDPAKLLAASVTVGDILDAVRRTNLIDSPGCSRKSPALSGAGRWTGERPGAAWPNRHQDDAEPAFRFASAMSQPWSRGCSPSTPSLPRTASRQCCSASTASPTPTRSQWPMKFTRKSITIRQSLPPGITSSRSTTSRRS